MRCRYVPRVRWVERSRLSLKAGACLQDSRFWGRGSDSEDDSEEEVSDSEEEEESDASDSDSDSSDNDDAAGYALITLQPQSTRLRQRYHAF